MPSQKSCILAQNLRLKDCLGLASGLTLELERYEWILSLCWCVRQSVKARVRVQKQRMAINECPEGCMVCPAPLTSHLGLQCRVASQ